MIIRLSDAGMSGVIEMARAERSPQGNTDKISSQLDLTGNSGSVRGLPLYDNFSSGYLDPLKWVGEPASELEGGDKDRREVVVEVVGEGQNGKLRLAQTNYDSITDNDGAAENGFGIGFANPAQITAIAFSLTVNKAKNQGCTTNPDNPGSTTVGFFGDYFNPSLPQNGQTGDVVASVGVTNFSFNTDSSIQVGAQVSQCQDATCFGQTTLSSVILGYIEPGSTNTLFAKWDRANHQFLFALNNNAPVAVPYNLPDTFPPGSTDESLFVFGYVPHCTSTPRPVAALDTLIDNVYVK
jgi:hypothetical protein